MPHAVKSYAAHSPTGRLGLFEFDRRSPRPDDVVIEILYCGVCHSDVHNVRNDWGSARYPMVPGHEIVGRVLEVGAEVTRFKAGDPVGVGCMVESCRHCNACGKGWEQYCENGATYTYNGTDPIDGTRTYGGYSEKIVVAEHFVLKMPEGLDLAGAAPLLCAGITTYSPLRHWNVGAGSQVAIVGLGGLGHMGLKLAKAMGAPEADFAKTMETWNKCVADGKDAEFGRTSFANALDTAPYYAIKIAPGIHHTMGGVKINTEAEVLNTNGAAISGLYAAGEITGGVHGANRLGGNAVADIVVFGRIAGANAADNAK